MNGVIYGDRIPHPIPVGGARPSCSCGPCPVHDKPATLLDLVSFAFWQGLFAIVALLLIGACMIAFTGTAGCSVEQRKADEAAINAALVKLEGAVDWVQANPTQAHALVAEAVAVDPSNKTLQAVAAKAHAAIDSGEFPLAHLAVVGGIALTQPTAVPGPVK